MINQTYAAPPDAPSGWQAAAMTTVAPGRRRATFVVLGGLSAFGPLSTDLYLPALPAVGSDLAAGQSLTQLTISVSLIGLALGQLVAGPISDNFGRRRPLLLGLAAFALLSVACAVAPNIGVLVVFRFLQGLAGAVGLVISRAMVRDIYGGRDAARVFAELTIISGIAPIGAPLLGGQLLRVMPWRGLFLILAGIGVLLFVGALAVPESLPPERRRSDGLRATARVAAELLRTRAFLGYVLAGALAMAALLTYISASPFVLQEGYGVSPQTFSLIFASNAVGIIAVSQIGGRLTNRVGSPGLLLTGLSAQVAGGVGVLVVGLSGSAALIALVVPLFVVAASNGLIGPHATGLALAPHPDVAGSAAAILGASGFLLAGLISPLGGLGGHGSALALGVTVTVAAGSALATYLLLARPASP